MTAMPQPRPIAAPVVRSAPSRLYLEATSRCNLRCAMCVKHAAGEPAPEGDLDEATFAACEEAFPHLDALVLNGVGEPLLHPGLLGYASRARALMPPEAWIGFQSNGHLLDAQLAGEIVGAGVNTVCVSIDALSPERFGRVRAGGRVDKAEQALALLAEAGRAACAARFVAGAEFVLRRDNAAELPGVVRRAARLGAGYLIVTHMLAYDPSTARLSAFSRRTGPTREFVARVRREAARLLLDPARYEKVRWRYRRSGADQRVVDFVEAAVAEARQREIPLRVSDLWQDEEGTREAAAALDKARAAASASGLRLLAPAREPLFERRCGFVEGGGAFVSFDGEVSPCYALWRDCRVHLHGRVKHVRKRGFGNVREAGLLAIWNDPEYTAFRQKAAAHDYPFCASCNMYPCSHIDGEVFEADCYAIDVPCGDCQWCLGLLGCLGQDPDFAP